VQISGGGHHSSAVLGIRRRQGPAIRHLINTNGLGSPRAGASPAAGGLHAAFEVYLQFDSLKRDAPWSCVPTSQRSASSQR
jgi:hypothetical protein